MLIMKASGVQITLDSTDFDCMDQNFYFFFPKNICFVCFKKERKA